VVGDHIERGLRDEGFRTISLTPDVCWWHDDLGNEPTTGHEQRQKGLTTADALRLRGRWEQELHDAARDLGYALHIGDEVRPGHWNADLTPLDARAPTGFAGSGATPLLAGRDVLRRARLADTKAGIKT
jgi:hypothetical protein